MAKMKNKTKIFSNRTKNRFHVDDHPVLFSASVRWILSWSGEYFIKNAYKPSIIIDMITNDNLFFFTISFGV